MKKTTTINTVTAKALAETFISDWRKNEPERRGKKEKDAKLSPEVKKMQDINRQIAALTTKRNAIQSALSKKLNIEVYASGQVRGYADRLKITPDQLRNEIILASNVEGLTIDQIKERVIKKYFS